MKIQVNSDKTISVDVSLIRFVEGEVRHVLSRFAIRLTRVEVHLSDVDNRKTGQADKRCLIEVRPAGARPLSTSAKATKLASAVGEALKKMQRLLTTFFGRRGRTAATVSAPVSTAKNATAKETVARKTTLDTKQRAAVKKAAVKKPTKLSPRGPKKKGIYQARRKAWPAR
jgi:Sigma 54 modulation protein / S30EA ribosomal protein